MKLETIAIQSLRHRIFSAAPKLRQLVRENADDIVIPFLTWMDKHNLPMNWLLHVALLNWLHQQIKWRPLVGNEIAKELLIASATRWALSGLEHIEAKGILIASHYLPDRAVGLWKSKAVDQVCSVQLIRLKKSLPDGFAISYVDGSWDNVNWVEMPATIRAF